MPLKKSPSLEKLQTDSLEQPFYTKMTPPTMFSWKSSEIF